MEKQVRRARLRPGYYLAAILLSNLVASAGVVGVFAFLDHYVWPLPERASAPAFNLEPEEDLRPAFGTVMLDGPEPYLTFRTSPFDSTGANPLDMAADTITFDGNVVIHGRLTVEPDYR